MVVLKFLPCEKANANNKHVLQWMRNNMYQRGLQDQEYDMYPMVSPSTHPRICLQKRYKSIRAKWLIHFFYLRPADREVQSINEGDNEEDSEVFISRVRIPVSRKKGI